MTYIRNKETKEKSQEVAELKTIRHNKIQQLHIKQLTEVDFNLQKFAQTEKKLN